MNKVLKYFIKGWLSLMSIFLAIYLVNICLEGANASDDLLVALGTAGIGVVIVGFLAFNGWLWKIRKNVKKEKE